MTARLKLGAQALSVALVLALLALLVWKVTHQNTSNVATKVDKGHVATAPDFTLGRLDRPGDLSLASLRGKPSSSTSGPPGATVQAGGAAARARVEASTTAASSSSASTCNDFSGDARKFMRKHGLTYPVVHDNRNVTRRSTGSPACPRRSSSTATGGRRGTSPGAGDGVEPAQRDRTGASLVRLLAARRGGARARRAGGWRASSIRPWPSSRTRSCARSARARRSPSRTRRRRQQIKRFIQARIAAGDTRSEIKDKLVAEYGTRILAAPPQARVRPARLGAAARRGRRRRGRRSACSPGSWSRAREEPEPAADARAPNGRQLDPELERRVDEELAALRWLERIPVAFLAGVVSIAFPCVLPLVPGYLSAISAVEVDRLGRAGRGEAGRRRERAVRRSASRSCSSLLGATAAAIGGWVDQETRTKIAGFVLVVLGLAFVGLLPWPERMLAPGACPARARERLARAARRRPSRVCAAPCVGVVLGAILALAADSRTVVRGCVLLAAYSLGHHRRRSS